MSLESLKWTSFWDIASPRQAATLMIGHYGQGAAKAAAICAFSASDDGRTDDYKYWRSVFEEIDGCLKRGTDP